MKVYEIIKQIHESCKNVVRNLARLTAKTTEIFGSHAREPKTQNPLSSGNVSPVTRYMPYVRQYQAAENGAGKMLNRRVFQEMEMEFAELDCPEISQRKLHSGVLKESFDVLECLNKFDFKNLSGAELAAIEAEGAQLRDAASDFVSHIRAVKKMSPITRILSSAREGK